MLVKVLVANSRTTEIYVDAPEGEFQDDMVEQALKKAQHEVEWYPEDQSTVLRITPATEEDKKKVKESNEPVYISNIGSWI